MPLIWHYSLLLYSVCLALARHFRVGLILDRESLNLNWFEHLVV
jgi:hypothetical protein